MLLMPKYTASAPDRTALVSDAQDPAGAINSGFSLRVGFGFRSLFFWGSVFNFIHHESFLSEEFISRENPEFVFAGMLKLK